MESLGINFNYLLIQIGCFAAPAAAVVVAVVLLIRRRNQDK